MDNNKIFEKTKMKIAISNDGKIDIMDLKVVNEKNEKVFANGRKFYPAGRSDGDGMISVKELVVF